MFEHYRLAATVMKLHVLSDLHTAYSDFNGFDDPFAFGASDRYHRSNDILNRSAMLGALIGSVNKERVLIFLIARERGYARQISRFYDAPLDPIQKALDALERSAILVSRAVGNTREYEFNPRYPLREELRALLEKALSLYPEALREELLITRKRPRRKDKPL